MSEAAWELKQSVETIAGPEGRCGDRPGIHLDKVAVREGATLPKDGSSLNRGFRQPARRSARLTPPAHLQTLRTLFARRL